MVQRAEVASIRMNKSGKAWRIVGTGIGIGTDGAGAGVAGYLGASAAQVAWIPVVTGTSGYVLGWAGDHRTVVIHVVPEKRGLR